MTHILVTIDTAQIIDWQGFHQTFAQRFGFPAFYGCNLDAWIDCMSALDEPEAGLSTFQIPSGTILVLALLNVRDFSLRCTDIYAELLECSALVNFRRLKEGREPLLCLSFNA